MPVVFDSFIISLDISSIGTAFASAIVETFAIAVSYSCAACTGPAYIAAVTAPIAPIVPRSCVFVAAIFSFIFACSELIRFRFSCEPRSRSYDRCNLAFDSSRLSVSIPASRSSCAIRSSCSSCECMLAVVCRIWFSLLLRRSVFFATSFSSLTSCAVSSPVASPVSSIFARSRSAFVWCACIFCETFSCSACRRSSFPLCCSIAFEVLV
ncbi:hypothetical protein IMSAGC013_01018 [Lachnospiraceae bacterium]|nr:hypothetical protein IMSAGC013_01018 [Lachnospiraceae bacterium]